MSPANSVIRTGGFLLLLMFVLEAGPVSGEGTGNIQGHLPDSPVPFYHTYNLTSLFPVGATGRVSQPEKKVKNRKTLSLDDCLAIAVANNPAHNRSRENLRAVVGDLVTAWARYFPTLRASYGFSQSNQSRPYLDAAGNLRFAGGISKTSYATLNFSFNVFDRARKYFEMKNAYYLRDELRQQLRNSEIQLFDQLRRVYFNVLRQEKLLAAAKDMAERRRDQLRLAEARYSVGSVTKLDVLQAQIQLKDQELVIMQYENSVKTTKMELKRIMGVDLDYEFELVDEFEVREVNFDVEALVREAVENHPEVKSLLYRIKQQEASLWMGRLGYLPILSVGTNYSRSEDGLELTPRLNKGRRVSFNVSWDIWDAFNRFRQNRYLEVSLNNLKYELAELRLDIEQQVRENYLELLRLYQRTMTLEESKKLATQSLELERERYRLGASSLLDLRQAQADYSQAEAAYINSIYDFHEAISSLSRSVGRDLSLY